MSIHVYKMKKNESTKEVTITCLNTRFKRSTFLRFDDEVRGFEAQVADAIERMFCVDQPRVEFIANAGKDTSIWAVNLE